MRIALDAMGGDFAPSVNIDGAISFLAARDNDEVLLVGDSASIEQELKTRGFASPRMHIVHASEVVAMDDAPTMALRRKKDSSLRRTVEMVKEGRADAAFSTGNSGAMMALSVMLLGRAPGVERPAIATFLPALNGRFLLLDMGANVDCTPEILVQFALMGDAYSRVSQRIERPRIGILNIGEEPSKGNELTKQTFAMLEKLDINFIGNVESKDAFMGRVDVVVCDGFVGNIFLKTCEGTVELFIKMLKAAVEESAICQLGGLLMKPAFKKLKKHTDYDEYGGAPLLGINGACFISHGRSNAIAIKNGLITASDFAQSGVVQAISQEIKEAMGQEKGNA